jgi:hypothetical protein
MKKLLTIGACLVFYGLANALNTYRWSTPVGFPDYIFKVNYRFTKLTG